MHVKQKHLNFLLDKKKIMTVIVFYCSLSTILNVHCFNDHQEIQREGDEIQAKYIKIYNNIFKKYIKD